MKLHCPNCDGDGPFYATQVVRGSVTVLVDLKGQFLSNCGEGGNLDANGLDFDSPEGPYQCATCGADADEEPAD